LDSFYVDLESLAVIDSSIAPLVAMQCPVDIRRYLPLIAQLAFEYWRKLPPDIQYWLDVEDVVQEGCACAIRACRGWTPERGRPITLIHTAVANMLKNKMLEHFYAQKRRAAGLVSIDAYTATGRTLDIPMEARCERETQAKKSVERLLEFASDETRRFIAETLLSPDFKDLKRYGHTFLKKAVAEIRALSARHQITCADVRLVVSMK
jgi:DNA-directed RNA polymerase specialized sigma24 family protein